MKKIENRVLLDIFIKLPKLFTGFIFASIGITLMITAGIGMNPWGTFTSGLVNITGLSFGRLSQLIGFIIILGSLPIKSFPGIGTLLNMIFIGVFIDFFKSSGFFIQPNSILLQLLMCITGLTILSLGIYTYISCGLGAGPRDGLMLALMRITGKSVTIIKPIIEITVILIGFALGGPIGFGTVIVAILGGKFLSIIFNVMKFDPEDNKQQNLVELSRSLFSA